MTPRNPPEAKKGLLPTHSLLHAPQFVYSREINQEIKAIAERQMISEEEIKEDISQNKADDLLRCAIILGFNHLVLALIAQKPKNWNPDSITDEAYRTLLMHAVANGNLEATVVLLKRGANVNYQSGWHLGGDSVDEALEILKKNQPDNTFLHKVMKQTLSIPPEELDTLSLPSEPRSSSWCSIL